jgi:hypothetical protein
MLFDLRMVMNIAYILVDANECPLDQLNAFLERYPGLDVLIEEFEHLSMAREDDDYPAIAYFKKQREVRLREDTEGESMGHKDTNVKSHLGVQSA